MEEGLAAIAGGLGIIVLGLMGLIFRGSNGTANIKTQVDFVRAAQKNGDKIDALKDTIGLQHQTLKDILSAIRANGGRT